MLARIISLFPWEPAPLPPASLVNRRGIWLIWKEGSYYHCETPVGVEKVTDVQRIIEAAKAVGAIIKWLD